MHRISKNKKGFTLLEMVLVVAIIIMLAAVVTFNAVAIYRSSKAGEDEINESQNSMTQGIQASEAMLANHNF